jgi:carbonic anhydrase
MPGRNRLVLVTLVFGVLLGGLPCSEEMGTDSLSSGACPHFFRTLLPFREQLVKVRADEKPRAAAALSAADALRQLMQGNERFVRGQPKAKDYVKERAALAKGQQPYAMILTCSDSRVAPEIIFDESLGKLFVLRVAGNVLDPVVLGSIEYAAEKLHAPLLVILGHNSCGAVQAALSGGPFTRNVESVEERIRPAAQEAKRNGRDSANIEDAAVRENVLLQVRSVPAQSSVLKRLIETKQLQVIGAVYHLESGKVEMLSPKGAR